MTVEKDNNWSSPTLREVPFWREGMTQDEYELEREYYAKNFHLLREGGYIPLWKQKSDTTSQ